MSIRNHLTATVSSACLVLHTSAPLYAQSIADIITDRPQQSISRAMRNQNVNAAHQAMMSMQSAHTMMKRLVQISKLYDNWNDTREPSFLAIEKWIKDNKGEIERYRHIDGAVPYQARLHGSSNYNIKYRVCGVGDVHPTTGLPERGYRYAVMTILPKLPVGYDSLIELYGTAGLHDLKLRDVSLMPDDRRHGTIGVFDLTRPLTPVMRTLDGTTEIELPECIKDDVEWYSESRTFDLETLAIFEWVSARELDFSHKMQAEAVTDTALCREPFVSADYGVPADATIGQAQFARGSLRVWRGSDDNPTTYRGKAINPDNATPNNPDDDGFLSDWAYTGGCRAPRQNSGIVTEACTWTVAGVATESSRTWHVEQREIPPARGYYLEGETPVYAPIPGTAVPHVGLCDGDAVAPRVVTTQASDVERQTGLQCSANFPDGSWDRKRSYTDTTGSMRTARPPLEWSTRTYGDWVTTRNGCSKTTSRSEREAKVVDGCIDQYRNVTVTTVSYASGATPSVTRSNPAWITEANRCASKDNSDSGGDKSWDVNGDGQGDYSSRSEAVKAGHTGGHPVDGDCGRCDGPKSGGVSSTGSSDDTQSTSSGGGFWDSVRDFFSGGDSSSDGGSSGCFVAGTLVTMADGSRKKIEMVEPGDLVLEGGEVIVTGQFLPALMYNLGGVQVSGSHLVAYQSRWIPVEEHPDAEFIGLADGPIYNIGTEHNTMVCSGILFADHLEIAPDLVEEALTLTAVEALARLNAKPSQSLIATIMTRIS